MQVHHSPVCTGIILHLHPVVIQKFGEELGGDPIFWTPCFLPLAEYTYRKQGWQEKVLKRENSVEVTGVLIVDCIICSVQ